MIKKTKILAAVAAAIALSAGVAFASDENMEKCKVVDKEGKGLIKAGKGDCAGTGGGNSCAGHNVAGDPGAWIAVPKGECAKINAGDFSGVDESTKDKIEGAH